LPIEGGMLPERKFSVTQRYLRDVTLPKGGITPVKEFIWISTTTSLDELANKTEGIPPVRVLRERINVLNEELLANEYGILPVRLLFARLTWLTVELVPNESGMLPSRWFPARFRVWSCGNLPNSLGMAPVSPLLDRFTCHKDVRFARQLDISPRRSEEPRSRETTRVGSPLPQVTPGQLQKLNEVLSHGFRMPKGSEEMPDLKQRRDSRSTWVLFALASAVLVEKRMNQQHDTRKRLECMFSNEYRNLKDKELKTLCVMAATWKVVL
jgi:hypothetical protein